MGFESFRVELCGGRAGPEEVTEAVRQLPHARPDPDSLPMGGSTYFLIDDSRHVIEVEVTGPPVKVSCRFTLCHPPTVDAAFLSLVRELMDRLGMKARACDDAGPEGSRWFGLGAFAELAAVIARRVAARRAEWVAAFGDAPLAATTNEAHQRVILPRLSR